ncbi:MAG TPA: calcium-binding protein, partial [Inquilinus sp.]
IGGFGVGGHAQGDSIGADVENLRGSSFDDSLTGSAVANRLQGSNGHDTLIGLAGDDVLEGEDHNDILIGGAGADVLDGGAGLDTADYMGSAIGVSVNLGTGVGSSGDAQGDTLIGIENLAGSALGDTLMGNGAANVLDGRGSNDLLRGGAGADTLIGGDGVDTASYGGSLGSVNVSLATGLGSGGDAQGDTLTGIENLAGSIKADVLAGNDGVNALQGFAGNDLLRGGAGADALDGGADVDTASYFESAAGVSVSLLTGTGVGGNAQGDTLLAIENISGSSLGNDILTGTGGANTLRGWGGDDVLYGGAGADTLEGGAGIDTASYYNAASGVVVGLESGGGSVNDALGDKLTGIENLSGSQGHDALYGDAGANVLQGWNGNDTLLGGIGKDTLSGGAQGDRFYFELGDSVVGANADVITDFSHAQGDKIDLSLIDADTGVFSDQEFNFIGTALYSGTAGELRYAVNGGVTTIAGDVDGDGSSDFHIQLTGMIGLVASDFTL